MKTKNTNTRKNKFLRIGASGLLLAILFAFVFAGVLSASFAVERNAIEQGSLEANVADAGADAHSSTSINIDMSPTSVSAQNISFPYDVSHRGYCESFADSIGVGSNSSSSFHSTQWKIGSTDGSTGQQYAVIWYDFDFGNWYQKWSDSVTVKIKGTLTVWGAGITYTSKGNGVFAAVSSSSKGTDYSSASSAYSAATSLSNKATAASNNHFDWYMRWDDGVAGVDFTINLAGPYLRLYLGYTQWTTTNVGGCRFNLTSFTATRTRRTFPIEYNANGGSGTVSNTTGHKYMLASGNVAVANNRNFFTRTSYIQTGWNTAGSNGNVTGTGVSFGASIPTDESTGFGLYIKNELAAGRNPKLYAVWALIGFRFYNTNYDNSSSEATYTNQLLQILETKTNTTYIAAIVPSGFSQKSITYTNRTTSANLGTSKPTTQGLYSATITIQNASGDSVGTRTINFEIVAGDFAVDPSGDTTKLWGSYANPFYISSAEHLKNLAGIVNGTQPALNSITGVGDAENCATASGDTTYAGCYFKVAGSFTATGFNNTIGRDSTHYFAGYFNGNGATITLPTQTSRNCQALFGYIKYAKRTNPESSSSYNSNVVTTITNLTVACSGTLSGAQYVASIVAYMDGGVVSNCTNSANISGTSDVGGIVGTVNGSNTSIIQGCSNSENVSITATSGPSGGIVGSITASGTTSVTVSHCYNSAEIKSLSHNYKTL